MKIDLKTTIIASVSLAVTLNVIQFFANTESQAKAMFAPAWADANTASTTPAPAPTNNQTKVTYVAPKTLPGSDAAGGTGPTLTSSAAIPPSAAATFVATDLLNNGLNSDYASLYLAAGQATGTPWELLAAVHKVETGQSGNTSRSSYAGATGPMQFMPQTFYKYAPGGNIDSVSDSVYAAGHLLAAAGASRGDYTDAVYSYNHSWTYVDRVMSIAQSLGL
jgi:membrane-bound lytic murein transglycosylase B